MDVAAAEVAFIFFKEARNVVGIPIAVVDPSAEEPGFAGPVGAVIWVGVFFEKFLDGICQVRGDLFIGVEAEYPGLGGVLEGEFFLFFESFPGAFVEGCAVGCEDFLCFVGAVVDDGDDFADPGCCGV